MRKPRIHLSDECLAEMERLFRSAKIRWYTDQQIADHLFARGLTERPLCATTIHHRRIAICGYRQRWRSKGPLARKVVRSYGWRPAAGRYVVVSPLAEEAERKPALACAPAPTPAPAPASASASAPAPAPAPAPAAAASAAPTNEDRLVRLERVLAQLVELQLRAIQKTT
jgi:hypothetical protein